MSSDLVVSAGDVKLKLRVICKSGCFFSFPDFRKYLPDPPAQREPGV